MGAAKPGITLESILERLFNNEADAVILFRKQVESIVQRYPPLQYSLEGCWDEQNLAETSSQIWEKLQSAGNLRFWFLSGAPELILRINIKNFVFNFLLVNAPIEQKKFYNQVVDQYRRDKRLTKRKFSKSAFLMGLTGWEKGNPPVYNFGREQLYEFWKIHVVWPLGIAGDKIENRERLDLFYAMLETVNAWVLDADFYNNFRRLVNFPAPGSSGEINHTRLAGDNAERAGVIEALISKNIRDRYDLEAHEKNRRLLKENESDWQEKIPVILKKYSETVRGFLYFLCIDRESLSSAAAKVGKGPSFATRTMASLSQDFNEFRRDLDSDDLPAMKMFLGCHLATMLNNGGAR